MKKILVIPHHPGLEKIRIRLVELARELSKESMKYVCCIGRQLKASMDKRDYFECIYVNGNKLQKPAGNSIYIY